MKLQTNLVTKKSKGQFPGNYHSNQDLDVNDLHIKPKLKKVAAKPG
ncbi:MAG: hypothetical protein JAY74_09115 [Candidatus Thiodiazotropha taylori]|nr:hypothetical protein [Candidatus Thiodiazotropha taylori]